MDTPLPRHDDVSSMIPVESAQQRVLSAVSPLAPIELPLAETHGCVLARDVVAPFDLPPFHSSAMDGYAVRSVDVAEAGPQRSVHLRLVGRVLMGRRPEVILGPGEAVRIATGAPVPEGADAVIPVEEASATQDDLSVTEPIAAGRHVRPAGEDARAGDPLSPAGRRLGAPELGMLASAGFARLPVYPRPRVVVLSTGDELVEPGKPLAYGQIYDSNSAMLAGAVREVGAQPHIAHSVSDDPDALRQEVSSHLATADAFVSTGGVSVGERDPVKAAFQGREIEFYRVAMQPGMPQGFGLLEGKPFFALPGNPVSVFVSFEVFVRPALLKMMGRQSLLRARVTARMDAPVSGPLGKAMYARVLVRREAGGWVASPTGGRGSNLMGTVARANGLAIVPPGVREIAAGDEAEVLVFRSLED